MSLDVPATFEPEAVWLQPRAGSCASIYAETALTLFCTAAALMFISFIAVAAGLV